MYAEKLTKLGLETSAGEIVDPRGHHGWVAPPGPPGCPEYVLYRIDHLIPAGLRAKFGWQDD